MKKYPSTVAILVLLLVAVILSGFGCAKKVAPPPAAAKTQPAPPPPPPPAPTITLSASPMTIDKGQSSTLTWRTSNASNVTISGGVGAVEPSGSRAVSPSSSTTYTASASGPGGTAVAETRVTVTEPIAPVVPAAPRPLTDSEFFSNSVKDAFFDYDKYDIRTDAQAALQGDARSLSERSGIQFTIEGHCDERGSEKYNLALGDRRANAAKQYLISQGVSAERIDTVSYGKERPFCTEHTEDCWQQNRRAHLVLR